MLLTRGLAGALEEIVHGGAERLTRERLAQNDAPVVRLPIAEHVLRVSRAVDHRQVDPARVQPLGELRSGASVVTIR